MSHTTAVKVTIKNTLESRAALMRALCDVYNLTESDVEVYEEPRTLHGYERSQDRTAHVIVRRNTLTAHKLGSFGDFGFFLTDGIDEGHVFYDDLDAGIPARLPRVKPHYSKNIVLERARRSGQHVDVAEGVDGSFKLTVRTAA